MSTLKVNNLQVGQDGTAANNYTLYQPASPDGTVRLGYGVAGSVTDVLTLKDNKLGIGTDNPGSRLHLYGGGQNQLKLESTQNEVNLVFTNSASTNNFIGTQNSDMYFYLNGGSRLWITSGGNIGIGTTSPTANFKLDINGDLTLGESGGSDNTYIDQKQNGSLNIINSGRQTNSGSIRINKTNSISGDTTYYRDLEVYDGKNNLVLLVDGSAGKVGINKSNPSSFLHVAAGDYQTLRLENTDNSSNGPYIELYNNSSSPADNDYTGIISFKNKNSNDEEITYSQIRSQSVDVTDGVEDGNITFHTRHNGSFGERLRIIENGMLGIGHHSAAQITKELTIRPANDGGIMIGRPGDTVTPINAHLLLTTTSAGQVFPSGEAYTVKYNTRNCDAIFTTFAGGGTGGNISFQTGHGNGNSAERLRINPDGNVNIGNKNHLSHSSTVDSLQIGYALNLYEDSYTNGTDNYVVLGNNVHYHNGNKYMRNDEACRIMMQAGTFYFQSAAAGTAGNAITFTDPLRITSSGDVGINITNPLAKLHVNLTKSSGSTTAERTKQWAAMRLSLDRTTGSMPYLGWGPALDFYSDNYDGATQRPNARIAGVVSNYSAGHEGGQLRFYTTPTDTATSESDFVERYRIESSGMIRHSGGHGNNGGNMNASAYYRITASYTVPASGSVTFVVSGLASGWMTIRGGGYSNAGQSAYAVMYQLGGYMTATNTYDVTTVQQWIGGGSISTQKNAQDFRITITNNSGSYGLATNWIVEGSNAGIKIRT